jgi:hypothetical protein
MVVGVLRQQQKAEFYQTHWVAWGYFLQKSSIHRDQSSNKSFVGCLASYLHFQTIFLQSFCTKSPQYLPCYIWRKYLESCLHTRLGL